jgi:dihydrofolate synthase/folylpolyglutamate synthase
MLGLAEALGHPERRVPCVHVAGTNGKGSVSAMLEAIFRAAGWRTGLYTSPHLVRLGERIQVNRCALETETLDAYVGELAAVVESLVAAGGPDARPSYFEFMTGLAFAHFAREGCDIAIIETGLGGRIDATNIVVPEVSVITSIGLDHCDFLGDTLEKIAAEKAGIIKPGRPVVLGRLPVAAERIIRAIAAEREAPVLSVTEEFGAAAADCPSTNLAGEHQRWNAATATLTARTMAARWRLDEAGMAQALQAIDWPGRWQELGVAGRRVIVDGAHNAEGAGALEANLVRLRAETGRGPIMVVGVLGASRAGPLLAAIARQAREIHLVVPRQGRACTQAELAALLPAGFRGEVRRSTVEAIFPASGECVLGVPGDVIVIVGSLYLAGEVLARLEPARGPLEHHLQDF